MRVKTVAAVVAALLTVIAVEAAVKPASPFKDGMVLQRGRKVPVWGKASPGENVRVEFAGQKLSAKADAKGAWRVELSPMKASKTPRTMKINGLEIKDVLVGEVWLASGQSNMALPIWNSDPRVRDRNGAAVLQIVRHRNVRYANLLDWKSSETPQDDIAFKWREHRPVDVSRAWNGGQSAVAFYFAEQLYQALDVPIGMIVACAGGTPIKPFYVGQPVFNHYFSPVAPYAVRGLIWYQGESDGAKSPEDYVQKLRTFLDGWAGEFENPSLPMYIAQICGFGNVSMGQALFAKKDKRAHVAVTADVGNPWDIHPNEKYTVGLRLAMLALKYEYGWNDVRADSPCFKSARREPGGKVRLSFDNAHSFYTYAMDYSAQTSFQLAGKDRKWFPARLENQLNVTTNKEGRAVAPGYVRGTQLVVSSPSVPQPRHVRYTSDPRFSVVYNESALPLVPFAAKLPEECAAPAAGGDETVKADFLTHLRVIENKECKGRVAQLAGVGPLAAPTAAELADPLFRRVILVGEGGRTLEEGEVRVTLGDIFARISAEKLKGVILDFSGTKDRELPSIYYAAAWVELHQNDVWGY